MDFGQLFSLIFASLLGLLPILLLIGRRARMRGEEAAAQDQAIGATKGGSSPEGARDQSDGPPSGGPPAQRTPRYDTGESSILSRIVRPDRAEDGGGREREARRKQPSPAFSNRVVRRPDPGPAPAIRSIPSRGQIAARRVGRLTPLQQAIVYREILGPPVALRDRVGSDAPGSRTGTDGD